MADRLAVLGQIFELSTLLSTLTETALAERGLTTARAEIIWRIHQHGPMVQRELSQVLRCTPRHVTGLVDSLQGQGWVERRPHPTDRRATLVHLTPHGESAATRMESDRRDAAAALFDGIAAADLDTFAAVLDLLDQRIRATDTIDTPSA
jgi:DNA-binding MarR family transcriptional regulator